MTAPAWPWIYPYTESPHGERRHVDGQPVLRPVVPIVLTGGEPDETARVLALIDSGSERTLAAPGIARQIGVTPDPDRRISLGVGGATRAVRFADVMLRLHSLEDPSQQVEWQAEVGFIEEWKPTWAVLLGQSGFFDRFTVTFGRRALAFGIEPVEAFDQRSVMRSVGLSGHRWTAQSTVLDGPTNKCDQEVPPAGCGPVGVAVHPARPNGTG